MQPAAQERSARSFRIAFQFRQVSIQLIVRDPFAAVELIDAAPDLRVDRVPVFQKPTILLWWPCISSSSLYA